MRRAAAAAAFVIAAVALTPVGVAAHAVLLRTVPPTGQTLSRAPDQVELLFSEPIDPVFTSGRVVDANGAPADAGNGHVDPNNDHLLVIPLNPGLPNGIYTVAWRSLSTIDVHADEGQFPLFIGVPVTSAASLTSGALQNTGTPETTFGRWWFYLAASLFGGVLATWKLVLGNVLTTDYADLRPAVRRRAWRIVLLGGGLLILGSLFSAVAQAASAAGVPLLDAIGRPLADLLLRGRFATVWWPRMGLELASLGLIVFGGIEGLAAECALATLPAVLLTSSLTSHGAALVSFTGPGIAIDWLHILGATAWVGGLISMLALLPLVWKLQSDRRHNVLLALIAGFSRFALAASALVVVSGLVQAAIEVGSWSALLASDYGALVLVKTGLFLAMLALAALNTWRGRQPASAVAQSNGARALRLGVRAELLLALVALGVAAVLTGTPPTRALPG